MLIVLARRPKLLIPLAMLVALGLQLAALGVILHLLQRSEILALIQGIMPVAAHKEETISALPQPALQRSEIVEAPAYLQALEQHEEKTISALPQPALQWSEIMEAPPHLHALEQPAGSESTNTTGF